MFDSVGAIHDVEGREGRLGAGLVAVLVGTVCTIVVLARLATPPAAPIAAIETVLPVLTLTDDIPALGGAPQPPAAGGGGGDPVPVVAPVPATPSPDTQPVDDPVLPTPDRVEPLPAALAQALSSTNTDPGGGAGPGRGAGPPGLGTGGSGTGGDGGGGIRVDGSELRWRKRFPEPVYPAAAARAPGAVDLCMAELAIDATGRVQRVELTDCAPAFHDPVRRALKKWRSWPTRVGGTAVPVQARVAIRFRKVD